MSYIEKVRKKKRITEPFDKMQFIQVISSKIQNTDIKITQKSFSFKILPQAHLELAFLHIKLKMSVSHPRESKSCRNDSITDTKELHPVAILKKKRKSKRKG